jgi:hypothetical protein
MSLPFSDDSAKRTIRRRRRSFGPSLFFVNHRFHRRNFRGRFTVAFRFVPFGKADIENLAGRNVPPQQILEANGHIPLGKLSRCSVLISRFSGRNQAGAVFPDQQYHQQCDSRDGAVEPVFARE